MTRDVRGQLAGGGNPAVQGPRTGLGSGWFQKPPSHSANLSLCTDAFQYKSKLIRHRHLVSSQYCSLVMLAGQVGDGSVSGRRGCPGAGSTRPEESGKTKALAHMSRRRLPVTGRSRADRVSKAAEEGGVALWRRLLPFSVPGGRGGRSPTFFLAEQAACGN